MIADLMSIDRILLSFESTLKIEYDERDTHKIITSAINKLENAYKVHMDKDIYELQAQNMLVAENLNVLISQISDCLKELALYIDISMFNTSVGISLADVNYMGFGSPELLTALKYLQNKSLYDQRTTIIEPITAALSYIDMCTIKRLFIILLVLERLGVKEGVSVVARFLYLGGLVV